MFLLPPIVVIAGDIEKQSHEAVSSTQSPETQTQEPQLQAPNNSEMKTPLERKQYSFLSKPPLSNTTGSGQKNQTSTNADPLSVSLGLIFILILIFSLAWFMKKMGYNNLSKQGQLKIVASLNLGPKEKIALIQVGEQQLLVGMTPTQINTLHVLDESIVEEKVEVKAEVKPEEKDLKNGTMSQNPFANKLSEFINNKTIKKNS